MKKFSIPRCIKHKQTKEMIDALIKGLEEKGSKITPSDYPSFHRMATSYDLYLTCTEVIAEKGATMVNLKGEVVKRPEVNIQKENWAQFLELAKEYGLTAKSGKILKLNSNEEEDSAFDKFVKGGIERR
jgi:P27 family predicted phage terminase small subunit